MPTMKRITDLSDYTSILPFASELFGVYQTLMGWRSKRQVRRLAAGAALDARAMLNGLLGRFAGRADPLFNVDHQLQQCRTRIGEPAGPRPRDLSGSALLAAIVEQLRQRPEPPRGNRWEEVINENELSRMLDGPVCQTYTRDYTRRWREGTQQPNFSPEPLKAAVTSELRGESAIAGLLMALVTRRRYAQLDALFYGTGLDLPVVEDLFAEMPDTFRDPFLTFDPTH